LWAVSSTPVGARRAYRVATANPPAAVAHYAVFHGLPVAHRQPVKLGTSRPYCKDIRIQPTDHLVHSLTRQRTRNTVL